VAGQIADPAASQQQGAVGERIAGNDPLQACGSDVQLGLDGRQGDVDDAEIQLQDKLRRADQRQRPAGRPAGSSWYGARSRLSPRQTAHRGLLSLGSATPECASLCGLDWPGPGGRR